MLVRDRHQVGRVTRPRIEDDEPVLERDQQPLVLGQRGRAHPLAELERVVAEVDLPGLDVDPQQLLRGLVPARPLGEHRPRLEQHLGCPCAVHSRGILPFVHRLRVRFHECDPQGIVFNAQWFTYFDVTLTELWREAFGSYTALVEEGSDVVVVDVQARFLAPGRFARRSTSPTRSRSSAPRR